MLTGTFPNIVSMQILYVRLAFERSPRFDAELKLKAFWKTDDNAARPQSWSAFR
jgi:hypothetical protein